MKINGLEIDSVVVGSVGTNCYIVRKEDEDRCVVIDPGDRGGMIARFLSRNALKVEDVLLTHAHFDHIMGVPELMQAAGGRLCLSEQETALLANADLNVSSMVGRPVELEADITFRDGQVYETAGMAVTVMDTPGHTKGSCCYYFEEYKVLFCGDTLFFESVGRTDLPTGSQASLLSSLNDKVFGLPDEVKVFPGHGPATDIGYEKKNNPYAML